MNTLIAYLQYRKPLKAKTKIILAFMLWYPLLTPAFSIKPCCATAAIQGSNKMSPISQLEIKNEIFKLLDSLLPVAIFQKLKNFTLNCILIFKMECVE